MIATDTRTETAITAYLAWIDQESYVSLLVWQADVTSPECRAAQAESDRLWTAYRSARTETGITDEEVQATINA